MKIQSLTGNWGYYGAVRERREGDAGGQHQHQEGQGSGRDDKGQNFSERNFAEEAPSQDIVSEAVKTFEEDAQTQTHGLRAMVEGNGPGLRVVLKDGSGNILRHYTGAEFIQLRNSSPKDGPACGKILDRKL